MAESKVRVCNQIVVHPKPNNHPNPPIYFYFGTVQVPCKTEQDTFGTTTTMHYFLLWHCNALVLKPYLARFSPHWHSAKIAIIRGIWVVIRFWMHNNRCHHYDDAILSSLVSILFLFFLLVFTVLVGFCPNF